MGHRNAGYLAELHDWAAFGAAFLRDGRATRKLHHRAGPITVTLKRHIATPAGSQGEVTLVAVAPQGVINGAWLIRLAEEEMGLHVIGRAQQDADSGGWELRARLPVRDAEVA